MRSIEYKVYVARRGNVFMRELAQLLVNVLRDLGCTASLLTTGLPNRADSEVQLVVAPHEYFHFALAAGASREQVADAAAVSVCLTTEQVGTPWFEVQADLCAQSPLLLDINAAAVVTLKARGFTALPLQLGYHPSIDRWRGMDESKRGYDVTVLAAYTDRRAKLLGRAIHLLWDRRWDLRLFTFETPALGSDPGFLHGDAKLEHLANSKVLLNVHRSELPYFEWLRAIEALANGCVLVSEESQHYAPLVPFEHFVQCHPDYLAEYAHAVLADESWRASLARSAYDFVRTELDMVPILGSLLPFLNDSTSRVRSSQHRTHRPAPTPAPPSPPQHALEQLAEFDAILTSRDLQFRERAKSLLLAHRTALRDIDKVRSSLRHGTDIYEEEESTSAYRDVEPDISVVIPNFNHSTVIQEAIDSVLSSEGVLPEIIVVDDHSTDGSVSTIRSLMAARDAFPILFVQKHSNLGLAEARNTGLTRSRAEKVFLLDADNVVYPPGLSILSDALDDDDDSCAFAYGVIESFSADDAQDSLGLVSCLPWDVFRLTRANYIDAMALVRRSCWEAVGGYDWQMNEHFGGWEDYDFWLRLASNGYHGAFRSTPIGRYRVNRRSMLQSFNLSPDKAIDDLRSRYPSLPWPPRPAVLPPAG